MAGLALSHTLSSQTLSDPGLSDPGLSDPGLSGLAKSGLAKSGLAPALLPGRERPELDPDLLAKIKPVTLAGQRTVPVPEPLAPLFPWGGLPRGVDVMVKGPGSWSLAMAMWAEALGAEGWLAVVGVPDLHLVAAAELGVRLDRVLVVETPGTAQWATVIAALLEAVDIVAVAPTAKVGRRDARRLVARAREQESLLFHLDGGAQWPEAADVVLATSNDSDWDGLGWGHGYLRERVVTVEGSGRRAHARTRSVTVTLPGPDGRLAVGSARPPLASVLRFSQQT